MADKVDDGGARQAKIRPANTPEDEALEIADAYVDEHLRKPGDDAQG